MKSLAVRILVFLANQLPGDIYFEQRLFLIKLMLAIFVLGFLSAIFAYFLVKFLVKKTKSWYKQKNRVKRLKTKKIPGAVFIGEVNQVFKNINVAVVDIMAKQLKVGDDVIIKGISTDTRFKISSMQIDRKDVPAASRGSEVGIKVPVEVRNGDLVYKVKG